MLTCLDLINKRKDLWYRKADTQLDKEFVFSVANAITEDTDQGKLLREEIQLHPEYLVQLTFSLVDKHQQTVPFMFNDVQTQLIETLNTAIEDFKAGRRHHLKFLILKGRQQG